MKKQNNLKLQIIKKIMEKTYTCPFCRNSFGLSEFGISENDLSSIKISVLKKVFASDDLNILSIFLKKYFKNVNFNECINKHYNDLSKPLTCIDCGSTEKILLTKKDIRNLQYAAANDEYKDLIYNFYTDVISTGNISCEKFKNIKFLNNVLIAVNKHLKHHKKCVNCNKIIFSSKSTKKYCSTQCKIEYEQFIPEKNEKFSKFYFNCCYSHKEKLEIIKPVYYWFQFSIDDANKYGIKTKDNFLDIFQKYIQDIVEKKSQSEVTKMFKDIHKIINEIIKNCFSDIFQKFLEYSNTQDLKELSKFIWDFFTLDNYLKRINKIEDFDILKSNDINKLKNCFLSLDFIQDFMKTAAYKSLNSFIQKTKKNKTDNCLSLFIINIIQKYFSGSIKWIDATNAGPGEFFTKLLFPEIFVSNVGDGKRFDNDELIEIKGIGGALVSDRDIYNFGAENKYLTQFLVSEESYVKWQQVFDKVSKNLNDSNYIKILSDIFAGSINTNNMQAEKITIVENILDTVKHILAYKDFDYKNINDISSAFILFRCLIFAYIDIQANIIIYANCANIYSIIFPSNVLKLPELLSTFKSINKVFNTKYFILPTWAKPSKVNDRSKNMNLSFAKI